MSTNLSIVWVSTIGWWLLSQSWQVPVLGTFRKCSDMKLSQAVPVRYGRTIEYTAAFFELLLRECPVSVLRRYRRRSQNATSQRHDRHRFRRRHPNNLISFCLQFLRSISLRAGKLPPIERIRGGGSDCSVHYGPGLLSLSLMIGSLMIFFSLCMKGPCTHPREGSSK